MSVDAEPGAQVDMEAQPAVTVIHHVSLAAVNLERTVQFYRDVLGLVVDPLPDEAHFAPERIWLGDGRRRYITATRSPDGQPGELGIGTIHHVALTVDTFDALLKWKRWLQQNRILVYGPYNQQAYRDLILTDPDGVLLELATRGPGWEATQDGHDVYTPPRESMAPFRNEEEIDLQSWPHPVTRIEPDMTLQGLHHVAAITSSLERTDAFYRDMLALPLVRKMIDSDDPEVERWYWGPAGGRPGALVTAFPIVHANSGGRPMAGRVGPGVPLHYALDMGSPAALQDRVSSLSAAGIEVTSRLDEVDSPGVSTRDPDGQVIELVTAAPGLSPSAAAAAQRRGDEGVRVDLSRPS